MKTIRLENSHGRILRSATNKLPSKLGIWFRVCFSLVTLMTLTTTSRATIIDVLACNCSTLTVQLAHIPPGELVAELGGVVVSGTYDYEAQRIVLNRPPNMAAGTYLLNLSQNSVPIAWRDINVCSCDCNCPTVGGPPGPMGPSGPQGPQGPAGPEGRQGPQGFKGQRGPQGTRPLFGDRGPVGPKGPKGDKGDRGATGAAGPQGPKGATGDRGANGPSGPPGLRGPVGPAGPAGATGPAGPAGPQGPQGPQGLPGPVGSTQYAYIYNTTAQVVPAAGTVAFSATGVKTGGIAHTPGSADIVISSGGDYKISFTVSGSEPNQFTLFVNGSGAAGATYGSNAGGQVILTVGANATVTLRNSTTETAVTLSDAAPVVNASILIQKLN